MRPQVSVFLAPTASSPPLPKFPVQPPSPKGAALGSMGGEEMLQEQPKPLGLPAERQLGSHKAKRKSKSLFQEEAGVITFTSTSKISKAWLETWL